jgi:hypothetical protein
MSCDARNACWIAAGCWVKFAARSRCSIAAFSAASAEFIDLTDFEDLRRLSFTKAFRSALLNTSASGRYEHQRLISSCAESSPSRLLQQRVTANSNDILCPSPSGSCADGDRIRANNSRERAAASLRFSSQSSVQY